METTASIQLLNLRNNILLFRKPQLFIMKRLLLLLVLAFFCATTYAQDSRMIDNSSQVMEMSSFMTSMKSSELNSQATYSNAEHIENLLQKVQPSVYLFEGIVKTYGEKPTNLYTEIPSLSGLTNSSILKNNIEIIIIKIKNANELNSTIDLSLLSGYKSLKYIYIISGISASQQNITTMIRNYEEKYSVFYKIDKGDKNQ